MRAACGPRAAPHKHCQPGCPARIGGTQMQGRSDGSKRGAGRRQAQAGDKVGRQGLSGGTHDVVAGGIAQGLGQPGSRWWCRRRRTTKVDMTREEVNGPMGLGRGGGGLQVSVRVTAADEVP